MAGAGEEIERLERRVAELEATVRDLVRLTGLRPGEALEQRPERRPLPPPAAAARAAPPPPAPLPRPQRWRISNEQLEQWLGQRGLLVVGVVALVAAGAFFLKYAFDRGWIAPWLRSVGAVGLGAGVALVGEQQVLKGLRRYGAGLIAAGAGLAYLGLWAAAGPYQLIGRQPGVMAIALLSGVLLWRAAHHQVETLAALAAAGAYLGPVLLRNPDADPRMFLAYLQVIALAFGFTAHRLAWRITTDILLGGYLLLPAVLAPDVLHQPAGLLYLAVGGAAALAVTRDHHWKPTRGAGLLVSWLLLLFHAGEAAEAGSPATWVALGAGAVLLYAAWDQHRAHPGFARRTLDLSGDVEAVLFLAGPAAFAALVAAARPQALASAAGLVMVPAAALYLAGGWRPRAAALVAVGLGLAALAVSMQLDATAVTWLWMLLAIACQELDRRYAQHGARAVAVALAALTFAHLFISAADGRGSGAAFTDGWALSLYGVTAGLAYLAMNWRAVEAAPAWEKDAPFLLWGLMAAAVFLGGSVELVRFFGARSFEGARLAQDLSLSVYWLLYAAAAVRIGFQLGLRAVRATGLGVAGLAAAKIVVYDLQTLDALYRVGSFLVLALIALAVAYTYHRRARQVEQG